MGKCVLRIWPTSCFRSGAALPAAGVRLATARHGGVTVTRVEIAREGLEKPRGRYVTLEMPSVSVLDERDAAVIETVRQGTARPAAAGRAGAGAGGGQPPGHGRFGPRTVQNPLSPWGGRCPAGAGVAPGGRHCAAGVSASTGLTLRQLAAGHGGAVRPAAPDLRGQPLQCRGRAAGPQRAVLPTPGCTRHRPTTPAT